MPWFEPYERATGADPTKRCLHHFGGISGGVSVEYVENRPDVCRECGCSLDLCSEMGCSDGDYLTRWTEHAARLAADLNARIPFRSLARLRLRKGTT